MSDNIKPTLKKRYEFLVSKTNKIWKLEKQKAELRDKKQHLVQQIDSGKKQSGKITYPDSPGTAAGAIKNNEEILESTKEQIDNIKEKQLELLEDIKSSIINI